MLGSFRCSELKQVSIKRTVDIWTVWWMRNCLDGHILPGGMFFLLKNRAQGFERNVFIYVGGRNESG